MAGARRQEAMRKLGFPESAVVAIDELVEVLLQLGGGHSVKGAEQEALEVRDGGVHLRKPFVDLLGGRGARLDLQALLEVHHAVRLPSVGVDAELVAQTLAERAHRVAVHMVHRLHGEKGAGAFVGPVLHGHEHGLLALGAASPLAASGPPAHEGVVQLHVLVVLDAQHVVPVAVPHGATDLVQHQLGRSPSHSDHLAQPLGGDAALVGGGEVDRGEPLGKGKARVLEQRPRGGRRLERAAPALPDAMSFQHVGAVVAASWALKSLAPANFRHGFQACVFGSKARCPFLVAGLFIRFHLVLICSFTHVVLYSTCHIYRGVF